MLPPTAPAPGPYRAAIPSSCTTPTGFPPELTAEIAREHGLEADLDGFEAEMERQREHSRAGQHFEGSMEMLTAYENLGAGRTEFTGHTLIDQESVVAAMLVDGAILGLCRTGPAGRGGHQPHTLLRRGRRTVGRPGIRPRAQWSVSALRIPSLRWPG